MAEVLKKSEDTQNNGKSLGAFVPEKVYWAFKSAAARRGETMQEAMIHAAYLYVDADIDKEGRGN